MLSPTTLSDEATLDARARRAARRVGLVAKKSRWRVGTVDNRGGFMLIEPISNSVRRGEKFELSAEAVVGYCNSLE